MWFTPIDGLMMATRSGDIDTGLLVHLLVTGLSGTELYDGLNRRSGLLGMSGVSADMRELLALEARGHAQAHLAIEAFCYRIRKYLGAYLSALGGADGIVFGGGIGANSPSIRSRVCTGMEWCGIALDAPANDMSVDTDACISAPSGHVKVFAIKTDEEQSIAIDVRDHLRTTTLSAE
jgi:acetate kinase